MPLDSAKASYKGSTWTEKGDGLATLRGVEDKAWENKLYTLVAFRDFSRLARKKSCLIRQRTIVSAAGMTISPSRNPYWMRGSFGGDVRHPRNPQPNRKMTEARKRPKRRTRARANADEPDKPDMVIWHYKDSRLPPMQQVRRIGTRISATCACIDPPNRNSAPCR